MEPEESISSVNWSSEARLSPAEVAASVPGWHPSEAKAKSFEIPGDVTPQKNLKLLHEIKHLIEKDLFIWDDFPIDLPATEFADRDASKRDNYFFQIPTVEDETSRLAFNPDGSQKGLSREQLSEVWRTGAFSVPSEIMPNQNHVWQLSGLLLRGKDNITASWRKKMATALRQLIEEIPCRFKAPRWSVRAGLVSLAYGPRDLLAKLVGLIETVPKYSDSDIEQMILREQKRFMIDGGVPQVISTRAQTVEYEDKRQPSFLQLPENAPLDKLDLRHVTQQYSNSLSPILGAIFVGASEKWTSEKFTWERLCREELEQKGVTDEVKREQTVVNLSCEERISRLYATLLSSEELERVVPGFGRTLVNYLKALRIVRNREMEQNRIEEEKRKEILESIRRKHPIRSRLSSWLESRCDALMAEWLTESRKKINIDILDLLRKEGLAQEAYLFDRGTRFALENEKTRTATLSALRRPARTWTFSRPIWLPKNWVIEKHTDESTGSVWYSAKKTVEYETRSSVPFYRLWNMYHWCISAWSYGFLGLSWNLLSGPLSFKALFLPKPYYSRPTLDSKTGKIVPDPSSLTQTFASRIGAIWSHIAKSRAAFEAEPDTGFIGKTKGLVGTVTVAVGQPALTALNIVLALFLLVTSFIWAPVSGLLRWIICFFFFDFDHAKYGNIRSPFVTTLLWGIVIRGVLNIVSSFGAAAVLHPLVAAVVASYGSVTAAIRLIYDSLMFAIVVWPRARVPANNGFLAKRIAGPGMASSIFVQIDPADALVALRGTLERMELELWRSRMAAAISKPLSRLQSHPIAGAFTTVGMNFNYGMHKFDPIRKNVQKLQTELERKVSRRYDQLPVIPNGHMVRLSRDDLDTVLEQSERMVKSFVTERVFPLHIESQIQQLWSTTWQLERDNWNGLAKKLVSDTFSPDILLPLEESDRTVRLRVKKFKFREMVVDAEPSDPLEKTTVEINSERKVRPHPTVSKIDRSDLVSAGSDYGRPQLIAPITRYPDYFTLLTKSEDEK